MIFETNNVEVVVIFYVLGHAGFGSSAVVCLLSKRDTQVLRFKDVHTSSSDEEPLN